ncbi:TatD family hydrolase [Enterobacter cloacae subsp. cloacae]|nr:TatD family hydrolase [Enterobacter cloacae subsp. cloacae]
MHCRDAHEHCAAGSLADKLPGAVLHCFTGSRQEALDCLDRGLYLGLPAGCAMNAAGGASRTVAGDPADRLLFETDAPLFIAARYQTKPASRRNEPAWLGHIVMSVAQWRRGSARVICADG